MDLSSLYVDVDQRPVYHIDKNGNMVQIPETKEIFSPHTDRTFYIGSDKYKIVTNQEVIETSIKAIESLGFKYNVDNMYSRTMNGRMRLRIEFPELKFNDGKSDTKYCLYINNSYTGDEGVRVFSGFIRVICSNGLISGEQIKKFYSKHTQGFSIDKLKETIEDGYKNINKVQERIFMLQTMAISNELWKQIELEFGTQMFEFIKHNVMQTENQWRLVCGLTYYLSHLSKNFNVTNNYLKISKLFGI